METLPSSENLDEFRWLVSDEAKRWLEIAMQSESDPKSLLATTVQLRRDLGASRTHLLIAQSQLRRRARVKFSRADQMYFTRQLLEQATDEQLAGYKAGRFPENQSVADLCCGIGGDLLALAHRCQATAVDRDDVAALLAETNCEALGRPIDSTQIKDAAAADLADYVAWHMDPDRRPHRRRTTDLKLYEPDLEAMRQMLQANPSGAIKMAPATRVPDDWREQAELEWLGSRGECRQQMAWFNELASHPGQRAATVFPNGTSAACTVRGNPGGEVPPGERVGRYVFEPHAAVLAADLTAVVAEKYGVSAISPAIPYLTKDEIIDAPEISGFEVLETLPFSLRRVRTLLRQRQIGKLEIKKRGVRLRPEQLRAEMTLRGDQSATLILLPQKKKVLAILCRRLAPENTGR